MCYGTQNKSIDSSLLVEQMKKYIFFAIAAIFISPLFADIEVAVEYGFSGNVKYGFVTPVYVKLKNSSTSSFTGKTVVFIGNTNSTSSFYSRDIELPFSSSKLIKFYIIFKGERSLNVKLDGNLGSTKIDKTFTTQVQNPIEKPLWLNIYSRYAPPGSAFPQFVDIPVKDSSLPDIWFALQSVEVIQLNQIESLELSSQQLKALMNWVNMGGILIATDSRAFYNKFGKQLSLAVPPNTLQIDRVGNGFLVNLTEIKELPKVKNIVELIFSFNKSGDLSSFRLTSYFRDHLREGVEQGNNYGWMMLMLVAYLFIIAPGDYLLSKKYKKHPTLTWWLFVGAIVVFTSFAYLKSYWLKSGSTRLKMIHCADVVTNSDQMIGRSFLGAYITRYGEYNFKGEQCFLLPQYTAEDSSGTIFPDYVLWQSDESSISTKIPIYSYRMYHAIWDKTYDSVWDGFLDTGNQQLSLKIPQEIKVKNIVVLSRYGNYQGIPLKNGMYKLVLKPTFTNHEAEILDGSGFNYGYYDDSKISTEKILTWVSAYAYFLEPKLKDSNNLQQYGYNLPNLYESQLNLSRHINNTTAVVLIFTSTSLKPIVIENESPQYNETNLVRMVVPVRGGK